MTSWVESRPPTGTRWLLPLLFALQRDYGRGFAEKSLRRMVQFAECLPDSEIVATLSRQREPHARPNRAFQGRRGDARSW